MYQVQFTAANDGEFYDKLLHNASFLFNLERDCLANMSNAAAMVGLNMPRLNWAGFYLWREEQLILGPFWGKPACTRIAAGSGVCGTAVSTGQAQLVADVHLFPGHIPCDDASLSEMVLPFWDAAGKLLGVFDLDAPELSRFSESDREGMTRFLQLLVTASDWTVLS